jgi:hypothetical protein
MSTTHIYQTPLFVGVQAPLRLGIKLSEKEQLSFKSVQKKTNLHSIDNFLWYKKEKGFYYTMDHDHGDSDTVCKMNMSVGWRKIRIIEK